MSRVDATPAELRRFAANLQNYITQVSESSFQLQAQFRQLSDTWRDQEHARFAQEFEQTMRVIDRFMNTAQQHVPFLLRKAQRLEDYLQQR